jgi:hypothetical protein
MEIAIAALRRELEMLQNNFDITAAQIERGEPTPYEDAAAQQALRAKQINGLGRGLVALGA